MTGSRKHVKLKKISKDKRLTGVIKGAKILSSVQFSSVQFSSVQFSSVQFSSAIHRLRKPLVLRSF